MPVQLPVLDESRKCGMCRACCTTMRVPELKKPAKVACKHVCGDGCAIYDERPATCQGYQCAWKLGYFTMDDRPDRIGMVFSFECDMGYSKRLLVADEVWPGARLESRPDALILQQHRDQLVLVRSKDGSVRKLIGPDSEMDRVQPIVEAQLKALYGSKARINPDDPPTV